MAGYNSTPYNGNGYPEFGFRNNKHLSRGEITQIVAQQLRQEHGENYGRRKTFHDRPICHYCGKNGRVSLACRKRQYDITRSEFRIPFQNRQCRTNSKLGHSRSADYKRKGRKNTQVQETREEFSTNTMLSDLFTNSASKMQQTNLHCNVKNQSSLEEHFVSNTAQPNDTRSVPLNINACDADRDSTVTELPNDITQYSSVQLSNAEEYKTPKENNEDILGCDYDSLETLISRFIENTEIIKPERVKVDPAMESPTLGEQNNEKATNGIVSESEETDETTERKRKQLKQTK